MRQQRTRDHPAHRSLAVRERVAACLASAEAAVYAWQLPLSRRRRAHRSRGTPNHARSGVLRLRQPTRLAAAGSPPRRPRGPPGNRTAAARVRRPALRATCSSSRRCKGTSSVMRLRWRRSGARRTALAAPSDARAASRCRVGSASLRRLQPEALILDLVLSLSRGDLPCERRIDRALKDGPPRPVTPIAPKSNEGRFPRASEVWRVAPAELSRS